MLNKYLREKGEERNSTILPAEGWGEEYRGGGGKRQEGERSKNASMLFLPLENVVLA